MIHRRGFLKKTLGLSIGAGYGQVAFPAEGNKPVDPPSNREQAEYEESLAASPKLELLGIPRDWSLVREGFHPFSPARTLVYTSEFNKLSGGDPRSVREQVRMRTEKHRLRKGLHQAMPEEKFHLLVTIIDCITSYYRRPDLTEKWAYQLVWREAFSSCGFGRGFGLPHQFQVDPADTVATDNALVDWWLILLSEGIDYESLDEEPVFVLFAHAFDHRRYGLELGVWSMVSMVRQVNLKQVSSMDRVTAARFLNHQFAVFLRPKTKGEPCLEAR
jgi:hypothetical protein